MQYENTGEELRRRSVGEIISTAGLASNIQKDAAQVRELNARAAQLNALVPGSATAQAAETIARLAAAKASVTAADVNVRSLPSEIEYRRRLGESSIISARNQPTPAERETVRAEDKRRYELENIPVEYPQVPTAENPNPPPLIKYQSTKDAADAVRREGAIIRQDLMDARKINKETIETREKENDAALEHEFNIAKHLNDPGAVPHVAGFNAKSNAPYIYGYDRSKASVLPGGSDAAYRIPLVDANGRVYKARDVTRRAKALGYKNVEEYVEKELYLGRPVTREKIQ